MRLWRLVDTPFREEHIDEGLSHAVGRRRCADRPDIDRTSSLSRDCGTCELAGLAVHRQGPIEARERDVASAAARTASGTEKTTWNPNSPSAARMWSWSFPAGVVQSMPSPKLTTAMPRPFRSSIQDHQLAEVSTEPGQPPALRHVEPSVQPRA